MATIEAMLPGLRFVIPYILKNLKLIPYTPMNLKLVPYILAHLTNPCPQIMIRLPQAFQKEHANELEKAFWKSTVSNVCAKVSLQKDVFESWKRAVRENMLGLEQFSDRDMLLGESTNEFTDIIFMATVEDTVLEKQSVRRCKESIRQSQG